MVGLALVVRSMVLLWVDGKGLPMNAYPTTQLVTRSTYRYFAHPIYFGFCLFVMGISGWMQSPSGFWIITPICYLAVMTIVAGFEDSALRHQFGNYSDSVVFGLPPRSLQLPKRFQALAGMVIGLGPWAFLYWALSHVPTAPSAINMRMDWELSLPQPTWAVWAYSAIYPIVIATPLFLKSLTLLRSWVISAWVCTALGFALMLFLPNFASSISHTQSTWAAWLMQQNRLFDAEWMAAPSFHAAWTVITMQALSQQYGRFRFLFWISTLLVIPVPLFKTRVLAILSWRHVAIWHWMILQTERLGNSWASVKLGPFRIINHAVWSFLGAALGVIIVLLLAGKQNLWTTIITVVAGLGCAGLWGYWLEGSNRLSRPFGYYGFLFGSMISMTIYSLYQPTASGALFAAFATSAPFAQAVGRLRCAIQGCCHGRPVVFAMGINIKHPMSRVSCLANLSGKLIHPTPLYSIISNLIIGFLLYRLWQASAPWTLIAGLYLALSSLARFVEEHYRGEPQTVYVAGMAIYQWISVILFITGLVIMSFPSQAVENAKWIELPTVGIAVLLGLLAAFLMSIDFPQSNRRFSRLTVINATKKME